MFEFELKIVKYALKNEDWVKDMEEELEKIKKNKTWILVPRMVDKNVIGTKWVFRNKMNETSEVVKNKARLVTNKY